MLLERSNIYCCGLIVVTLNNFIPCIFYENKFENKFVKTIVIRSS